MLNDKTFYFNFHVTTGKKVATIKELNNKDWDINAGTKSFGKIIPTNNDFEKSGLGNNKSPPINPIMIDTNIFFSFNDLL